MPVRRRALLVVAAADLSGSGGVHDLCQRLVHRGRGRQRLQVLDVLGCINIDSAGSKRNWQDLRSVGLEDRSRALLAIAGKQLRVEHAAR
jgi:hypothetical protein